MLFRIRALPLFSFQSHAFRIAFNIFLLHRHPMLLFQPLMMMAFFVLAVRVCSTNILAILEEIDNFFFGAHTVSRSAHSISVSKLVDITFNRFTYFADISVSIVLGSRKIPLDWNSASYFTCKQRLQVIARWKREREDGAWVSTEMHGKSFLIEISEVQAISRGFARIERTGQ